MPSKTFLASRLSALPIDDQDGTDGQIDRDDDETALFNALEVESYELFWHRPRLSIEKIRYADYKWGSLWGSGRPSGSKSLIYRLILHVIGAQERTRTSTPLRVLAPEASASTIPPPGPVSWSRHVRPTLRPVKRNLITSALI